jgi:hypothetical protein
VLPCKEVLYCIVRTGGGVKPTHPTNKMFLLPHAPRLLHILRQAHTSRTIRILSLLVLLLSVAPLGSLYLLFFAPSLDLLQLDAAIFKILHTPNNATVDDLVRALFSMEEIGEGGEGGAAAGRPCQQHALPSHGTSLLLRNQMLIPQSTLPHVRIVMPWILSFLLGIVFPLIPYVMNWAIQRRRRRRRRRHQGAHHRSSDGDNDRTSPTQENKVLAHIQRRLAPFTRTLTELDRAEVVVAAADDDEVDDLLKVKKEEENRNDDNETATGTNLSSSSVSGEGLWNLPYSKGNNGNDDDAVVLPLLLPRPETCGICLDTMQVQQQVTWSSNCIHCYHSNCIQSWLLRAACRWVRNKTSSIIKYPCPICRQAFLVRRQGNKVD